MGTTCKGYSNRPNVTKHKKPDGWRKVKNPRYNREQRRRQ